MDRDNKFCLHDSIRYGLCKEWTRTSLGWVLSDRPDKVVYSQDEYDYNKQSFEDRFADRENEMEGIL